MKWFSLLLGLIYLTSCSRDNSAVKEIVKQSDSASIEFLSADGKLESMITIRDKSSIEMLGDCMDGKAVESTPCNETGHICFYENGNKKMLVDFSLSGDCNSFSYSMNNKLQSKIMNEDATKYLNGIREISLGDITH